MAEARKTPYTTAEFFNLIVSTLKKGEPEIPGTDYALADKDDEYEIRTPEFKYTSELNYGASEGIYLSIGIRLFTDGGFKTLRLGTIKTLDASKESMEKIGRLLGEFTYEASEFVNSNYDGFDWQGYRVRGIKTDGNRLPFSYSCDSYEQAKARKTELFESTRYGEIAYVAIYDKSNRTEEVFRRVSDEGDIRR